jgi:phosphomevalonate kinase
MTRPGAPRRVDASAPGKLMVSGEYAVLDGAVAVVAAVTARVYVRWSTASSGSPGGSGGSPQSLSDYREAVETRRLAEEAEGAVQGELMIEATETRSAGHVKYGLGSSAAAAAATAGAVLASQGHDLSDPQVQRRAFDLALAGHKAIAPQGSGADVAAASLGGFVRFRLEQGRVAEAERIGWPTDLSTRVVWTGKVARTNEFVAKVRAFEASQPGAFAIIRDSLHAQADRFAAAIAAGRSADIIAAAGAYGEAMKRLGLGADVPIVTPELQKIADLATEHGGSAKPSGAGGGDVALAFFTSDSDAKAFDAACRSADLTPLDLGLGAPGVRPETH